MKTNDWNENQTAFYCGLETRGEILIAKGGGGIFGRDNPDAKTIDMAYRLTDEDFEVVVAFTPDEARMTALALQRLAAQIDGKE